MTQGEGVEEKRMTKCDMGGVGVIKWHFAGNLLFE